MMVDTVEILYKQYKEGAISSEQLTTNLFEVMVNMKEEHVIKEYSNEDLVEIWKKHGGVMDYTNYIFNIQLEDCTIMGNIKINKKP